MEHKEIALIGKIAAGMTHEMKNVLAIIKESQGLMQDILGLSKDMAIPHEDKFISALEKIQKHVGRGVDMMTQFNRFAHMMDEEHAPLEANEAVELVVFLYQRFARQKQVALTAETPDGTPCLVTNPIQLLLALCTCLDHCLEHAAAEESITLLPGQKDREVSFQFSISPIKKDQREQEQPTQVLPDLGHFLGDLGAEPSLLASWLYRGR